MEGLQHVEVVELILSGGRQVKLDATDLSTTSIKRDRTRRTPGSRIGSKRSRIRPRASLSPQDRTSSEKNKKKSFSWKRLGRSSSLRRTSSVKRSKSAAGALIAKAPEARRAQLAKDSESSNSGPGSPPVSPSTHTSRPGKTHCSV